jgi:hypothetical protein
LKLLIEFAGFNESDSDLPTFAGPMASYNWQASEGRARFGLDKQCQK